MVKLVVNIGLMPRGFGVTQIEIACSLDDEIRFSNYIGEEVFVAAALSQGRPPLLIATATLERFARGTSNPVVLLGNLHFLDSEVEAPLQAARSVFSVFEDSLLQLTQVDGNSTALQAQEAAVPFLGLDAYGEIGRQLRESQKGLCGFSGVEVSMGEGTATPIVPLAEGGEVHVRNFIFLHDEPAQLFNLFAWTIGNDLEIIADAWRTGTDILGTLNPSGKLLVGNDRRHWPDGHALAWHRQRFLDRLR